jgi:hypothetical protein
MLAVSINVAKPKHLVAMVIKILVFSLIQNELLICDNKSTRDCFI